MLQCHAKGCTKDNFPLRIVDAELENADADFNPQFLRRMLDKIEWTALVQTSFALGVAKLPEALPTNVDDQEFLQTIHHVLMELVGITGENTDVLQVHKYLIFGTTLFSGFLALVTVVILMSAFSVLISFRVFVAFFINRTVFVETISNTWQVDRDKAGLYDLAAVLAFVQGIIGMLVFIMATGLGVFHAYLRTYFQSDLCTFLR
ncbi:hypothetical protein HDU93_001119 [Gonapodya sp. JEL0774]|nr:hypothetical protein HDU93_001119 [Gonapodya sp. JEL0774]